LSKSPSNKNGMRSVYSRQRRAWKIFLLQKQKDKCYYCKKEISFEDGTFDHKIPVAKGGRTKLMNLVISCIECNIVKSDSDIEEWWNNENAQ
jgi:5-methylcytosine-specific restriction endonuclease McrA